MPVKSSRSSDRTAPARRRCSTPSADSCVLMLAGSTTVASRCSARHPIAWRGWGAPARPRDIVARLGIAGYASAYPGTLPYGVQKRVIIARALMAEPSLSLLDKPVSGLSAQDIDDLANLIKQLRTRMCVAVVEHP